MNQLMIDNECLSLRPEAFILQVGYAVLSPDGEILDSANIWPNREEQEGRHIDINTVDWWMQQNSFVSSGVFSVNSIKMDSRLIFLTFQELIRKYEIGEVWANPPAFDLAMLRSYWKGKTPWSHRQERCMRTLKALRDPDDKLQPEENKMKHDAMADAIWQAKYLHNLLGD